MKDLSLHILDIAENSIRAGASWIRIRITEDARRNIFSLEISDNGSGMDAETVKKAGDPFFTTKACKRTGLGVPLLAQSAHECGGSMNISSEKGKGTAISVTFPHDHIDRKPLGDIAGTVIVLIASHPDMDLFYEHRRNDSEYSLDTAEIRTELDGLPLGSPGVIKFIKDDISTWLINTDNMIQ